MRIKIALIFLLLKSIVSMSQGTNNAASININSIDSNDFSDLHFLDTLINEKRVVFLGESHHGIDDYNALKFRLIRYLHQKHGFDVAAFESGFSNCSQTNYVKDSLSGMEMLVRSLIGVWRVKGNCELMNYIKDQHLELAGVDSNEASLGLNFRGYNILLKDEALARRFVKVDSLMLYGYTTPKSNYYHRDISFDKKRMESLILSIKSEYQSIIHRVNALETMDVLRKRVVIKGIESKLRELSTSLNKKDDNYFVTGLVRDEIMAKNLEYLLDSLYPNKKIIVWAHNAHIRKIPNYPSNQASIVDNLSQRIKDQSFIIGLYALNGECSWGMNAPVPIVIRKASFEDKYSGFASKALFVPSKNMDKKKREEGFPSNKAIVSELYDGVFIIRDVKASRLIRYNKEYRCE